MFFVPQIPNLHKKPCVPMDTRNISFKMYVVQFFSFIQLENSLTSYMQAHCTMEAMKPHKRISANLD